MAENAAERISMTLSFELKKNMQFIFKSIVQLIYIIKNLIGEDYKWPNTLYRIL